MKKSLLLLSAVCLLAGTMLASPMTFPGTIANARYVYVTSYDGDQYNPSLLPDDRQAISSVQDSIHKWGKLIVVYKPQDADVVLMVQSRPSEDLLAVYDAKLARIKLSVAHHGRSGVATGRNSPGDPIPKSV